MPWQASTTISQSSHPAGLPVKCAGFTIKYDRTRGQVRRIRSQPWHVNVRNVISRIIRNDRDLVILDRPEGDEGAYPQDDLKAVMGADGTWCFTRKDGTSW